MVRRRQSAELIKALKRELVDERVAHACDVRALTAKINVYRTAAMRNVLSDLFEASERAANDARKPRFVIHGTRTGRTYAEKGVGNGK